MERRGGAYFLVAIMIAMLAMIITSLAEDSLETKLLPIVLGSAAFILSAMELRKAVLQRRKHAAVGMAVEGESREGEEEVGTPRGYVIAGVWVVGFVLAIYLLGFIAAIGLVTVAYIRSNGATWRAGITSAIVTVGFVYGMFTFLLQISFYRGLLLDWLGG